MDWLEAKGIFYDVAIVTCGYESRAPYVLSNLLEAPSRVFALDYCCANVHHYNDNKAIFLNKFNADFVIIGKESILNRLSEIVGEVRSNLENSREIKILMDVSSCSRSVMAEAFLALSNSVFQDCQIYCTYALSAFDVAPQGELPSSVSEPVIGDLSGWSDDLSKPPCAVISLGFEPGRALGSIDYLEVPEVRLFMPQGPDARFEAAVKEANQMLISEAGADSVFPFDVLQPESTLQKLESLLFGLLTRYRPVVIPLGPKIFSAIAMVLAIRMFPRVCVWRTSAGSGEEVVDRRASGEVAVFKVSPFKTMERGFSG